MQLLELRLHNSRSFRDETIRLAPGTVLVGANNAGKTTIVDTHEAAGQGNARTK